MCECIEQVQQSVFDLFKKDVSQVDVIDPRCHFENLLIGSEFPLYIPTIVDYRTISKRGKETKCRRNYTITPEFCPFCGVKIARERDV
ncbi:hypothetical protein [Desulfosporosinus nitroreducens]|uniref:hypothetical protein n=1 Tax=Desulfosporosinus nitroreducens TaxID=2018668 RepID=UPI00207CC319|nr:hypothetical protein [Desulfosporosinus nitroreducens]MCO1599872.1 hypothetical protein [Desulfosporosinus nitroreducens]